MEDMDTCSQTYVVASKACQMKQRGKKYKPFGNKTALSSELYPYITLSHGQPGLNPDKEDI